MNGEKNEKMNEEKKDGRRLNAWRHGLTGQILLQTPEEQAAYDQFCRGIHQSLAPVGALEQSYVQSIADDRWRLHHAAAMETDIITLMGARDPSTPICLPVADDALNQAQAWLNRGKSLGLLSLYESRLNRHVEKNMAELRRLQAGRQALLAKALEEAELLAQLAEAEGQPFDPALDAAANLPDSFVFSPAEFTRLFHRNRRLASAKKPVPAPEKRPRRAA